MQAKRRVRNEASASRAASARASARWSVALGAGMGLVLAACAGSAKTPRAPSSSPAQPRAADELVERHPDDLQSSSRAELDVNALAPRPVATPSGAPSAARNAAAHEAEREPAPIRLDAASARPFPLREGELVLASGLVVHRVPKGVAVRAGRERQTDDPVWEILDRRGRRLALLKERSFRRASAASAPVLEETTTFRKHAQRAEWSRGPVNVIVERFHGEHSIYTLERLASGTDWIAGGLELRSPAQR